MTKNGEGEGERDRVGEVGWKKIMVKIRFLGGYRGGCYFRVVCPVLMRLDIKS